MERKKNCLIGKESEELFVNGEKKKKISKFQILI
jgi:hypothetical protein